MPNTSPGSVVITAPNLAGQSVTSTFNGVSSLAYDFSRGMIRLVDITGAFSFGYSNIATVTHVIAGGVTTVTIS